MVVRAYLRASTENQNAERARGALEGFAADGLAIVSTYVENESGARLDRPELFRLLKDCRRPGVQEKWSRFSARNARKTNKLEEVG